jgi:phage gp16-like protein
MNQAVLKGVEKMSLPKRKQRLALIHVAKKQCGLKEDEYRALLQGTAGFKSARDIEHLEQFDAVMDGFRKLGFHSTAKKRPPRMPGDAWRCSPEQRAKIEAAWQTVAVHQTAAALDKMARRITGVESVRWIDQKQAGKLILALRAMMKQAGYNPDTGE